jgi:hypothetical protein
MASERGLVLIRSSSKNLLKIGRISDFSTPAQPHPNGGHVTGRLDLEIPEVFGGIRAKV